MAMVVVGQRRIRNLCAELGRQPVTPGVMEDLRGQLARELEIGPLCLQQAAGSRVDRDLAAELERHAARGAQLAARSVIGALDLDRVEQEIGHHLAAELDLVAAICAASSETGAIAADLAKARDIRLYQL